MDPTHELLVVGAVVALTIAFVVKPIWIVVGAVRLVGATLFLVKWLVVGGLVVGFSCSPQVYRVVGWTPASLILGSEAYKRASRSKSPTPQPKTTPPHRIKGVR